CPWSPGCRARPWRNATGGVPRSAWGSRWSARWSSVDAANFPRQGGGDGGYYNYPVVRRPVWTWEVPAYFWLGGMAAGAYVTAALAQNFGSADDRRVAAGGYYVAATALVPCAPLLIADLGRPDRFYHMLRIFKPLSPMNLGAWTLTALTPIAFARAASHAASTGLLRGPLGTLARLVPTRLAELAGVVLGLTLAGYSGVLLAATNIPLWAKSKLLGGLFMASGLASGSAGVTLQAAWRGAPDGSLHRLAMVESAASAGEMAILTGYLLQSGKTARPLTSGRLRAPFWLAAVGEGQRDAEAALLPLVSSANIACGLHAGDPDTMRATVALALRHGVAIGAHPGFADRQGFGRRPVHLTADQVADLVLYQLGALQAIARAQGAALRHVKPHGALYNQAETDDALAVAIIAGIRAFDPTLRLVGRAGSAMQRAAAAMRHPFT